MDAYEKFLVDLKRKFDLDLTGYKRPQMERRINTLMRTLNIVGYDNFVQELASDKELLDRFIAHLTINVSEFFRNSSQWDILTKKIIPQLLTKTQNLKIWSAGCSTGEEPYTMAMVLAENFPQGQHSILATDFDARVLKTAQNGEYPEKSTIGIPARLLEKYFTKHDDKLRANDVLRKYITFRQHNLLRDPFPDNYDLIICRNVVIYFTEESKAQLYRRFYNTLRPGGILFTGSTEQIIQAREIGYQSPELFFYMRPL
ncbi:MAG: protein-glutamate O-methyltransferase CheR [Peptococcia bacterium]